MSNICFASKFVMYESLKAKECINKLNELKINYNILSYSLALNFDGGGLFPTLYTLLVEIEDKED